MSLFQCELCGCVENTALSSQGFKLNPEDFDWTGIEDRQGKRLCSACGPTRYIDGKPTAYGRWHMRFRRVFLPIGQFKTNRKGNLEHIQTGTEDYMQFEIKPDLVGVTSLESMP